MTRETDDRAPAAIDVLQRRASLMNGPTRLPRPAPGSAVHRPSLPRMRRLLAMLAVTALAVTACATEDDSVLGGTDDESGESSDEPVEDAEEPSTTDTTVSEGPEGFTPDPIEWDVVRRRPGVRHAHRPARLRRPSGDTIELDITRSPATGDRVGALFVNPGGPGASATELASPAAARCCPTTSREHFDIVGVDPRGVGGSPPIDCGLRDEELYGVDASIDGRGRRAALLDVSERYIADCEEQFGDAAAPRRHPRRRTRHGRGASGDGRRAAQLPRLQLRHRHRPGLRRPVPRPRAGDGARRRRRARADRSGARGRAGGRVRARARALHRGLRRTTRRAPRHRDADGAVDEVLAASEEADGIPAPDADRPAGPGEVNLGIAYALYSEFLWRRARRRGRGRRSTATAARMVDLADAATIGIGRLRGLLRGQLPRLRLARQPRRGPRRRQGGRRRTPRTSARRW